jgi:hypothetical protein
MVCVICSTDQLFKGSSLRLLQLSGFRKISRTSAWHFLYSLYSV